MTATSTLALPRPLVSASFLSPQRLPFHALVLAVLLAAVAPFLHLTGSYSSDEGAYAVQVHRLEQGRWDVNWPGAEVDPEAKWFPFVNGSVAGDRHYSYVQHPAWPIAMRVAVGAFGETVGLRLLPIAGAVGIAVAAWLLAAEIDSRRRRLAFWVAAAGPALPGATMLWAHTASAAIAGLAVFAAIRASRRGHPRWLGTLALLSAGGVLLRAEGLLWAAALGLACGGWHLWHRRPWRAGVLAATVWVPAVVAVAVERLVIRAVAAGAYADPGLRHESGSYLAGRVAAFLREIVSGGLEGRAPVLLGGLALVLAVVGGVRLARGQGAVYVLAGAAAVFGVRTLVGGGEPATGVLGCWPVAAAGLAALCVAGRRRLHDVEVLLIAVTLLFGAAVVVTQYDGGGGIEWGGRFFSPLLAPLAVLAAGGLAKADRRHARAAIALLAVVPALSGVRSVSLMRAQSAELVTRINGTGAKVGVTTLPALPRMLWATDPDVTWFLAEEGDVDAVLARLNDACVPRVALVVSEPRPATTSGYTVVAGAAAARGNRLLVAARGEISQPPIGRVADRLGVCPTGL